ncbi:MAG: hypothetical protein ACKVIY_11750 [Acidimicrobiales bacterium]
MSREANGGTVKREGALTVGNPMSVIIVCHRYTSATNPLGRSAA